MKLNFILVAGLLIFSMLGTITYLIARLERATDDRDSAIQFNNARGDSIVYLTNRLGEETARVSASDMSRQNLIAMQDDERLSWIRNFEAVNKNYSNLQQATRLNAEAIANFRIGLGDTTIVMPDSSKVAAKSFDNHNEWYRLRGFILPDTLVITPEVMVPLEMVIYSKRKKVLGIRIGRKEYFTEATSANPYVKITKLEVTRVGRK